MPDKEAQFLCLVEAIQHPTLKEKAKVREPDMFDGTDAKKLQTFLTQCNLNF